jgi:hypothetical protein
MIQFVYTASIARCAAYAIQHPPEACSVERTQVGFLAGFPQSFLNTPMDYVRLQLQLGQVHAQTPAFLKP